MLRFIICEDNKDFLETNSMTLIDEDIESKLINNIDKYSNILQSYQSYNKLCESETFIRIGKEHEEFNMHRYRTISTILESIDNVENIEVEKNINFERFKEITDKLIIENKSIVILKK